MGQGWGVRQSGDVVVATVVLCPAVVGPEPYDRAAVAVALRASGIAALVPDLPAAPGDADPAAAGRHYVAHLALAIAAGDAVAPVLPVLPGAAGALAAGVALSQRAARRAVAGYVLVAADHPAPGGEVPDWPDAPVLFLAGPATPDAELDHARLRDWRPTRLPDLSAPQLAQALLAVID